MSRDKDGTSMENGEPDLETPRNFLPETWREQVPPKPLYQMHVVQTMQTKTA
jgi:hypothetical protein